MYVGMNRLKTPKSTERPCVPHVRGDEPNE